MSRKVREIKATRCELPWIDMGGRKENENVFGQACGVRVRSP